MLAWVAGLTALAGDYAYLTFVTTDGAKVSVPVESLAMTVNGPTLTVGSQTFTLADLSKMYFSTTDEGTATGVETVENGEWTMDNDAEIYDLKGRRVLNGQWRMDNGQLPRGVYIVKTKKGTRKIVVK